MVDATDPFQHPHRRQVHGNRGQHNGTLRREPVNRFEEMRFGIGQQHLTTAGLQRLVQSTRRSVIQRENNEFLHTRSST